MTERKVLNKYIPPDYDYKKIPRLRREKNAQWVQRVMAPFNMRCNTCGHYIYRGTKFNARRETAQGETYLGLKIFRFYIRCPRCCGDIAFKTDIENLDYAIESGASRNFEAAKLAAKEEKRLVEEVASEEANNPMAVLENRTKDSRREMEIMENLEELKERADSVAGTDLDILLTRSLKKQQDLLESIIIQQEKDDEDFINSVYETTSDGTRIKRLAEEVTDCDDLPDLIGGSSSCSAIPLTESLVDQKQADCKNNILDGCPAAKSAKLSNKSALSALVKPKSKTKEVNVKLNVSQPPSVTFSKPSSATVETKGGLMSASALSILGNYSGSSDENSP